MISNSRGPESLGSLALELVSSARTVNIEEPATSADVVLVAIL